MIQRCVSVAVAIALIASLPGCSAASKVDDVAHALGISASEATTLLGASGRTADDWIRIAGEANAENNAAILSACVYLLLTDTGAPRTASDAQELLAKTQAITAGSPVLDLFNADLRAAVDAGDDAAAAAVIVAFDVTRC